MRRIHHILLALSAVALCQCASGPSSSVHIGTESKVAVYYEQPRQGLRQSLLGERVVDPREFYSDPKSDKFAKIASNAQLQLLVDGLAQFGFFAGPAERVEPDAIWSLRVDIDGVARAWTLTSRTPLQELGKYNQALAWFQNVYNQIDAYHTGGAQTDMAAEHARLQHLVDERTGGRKERP